MHPFHRIDRLLVLILIVLGATCCRGHAPTSSPTPLNPRGQIVTLWYPATYEEELLTFMDRFNASNPWGIALRGMRAESSAQVYEKVLQGHAEGKLPDMIVTRAGYLPEYVAQGLAVNLTPYIGDTRWGFSPQEQRDFFPAAWNVGHAGDPSHRYGFPLTLSAGILVYNRAWLHELGYDAPPRTWEELRTVACAASEPQAGIYGLKFPADERVFIRLLLAHGGHLLNSEGTAYTFGNEAGLAALTLLQTMVQEGCARPEEYWEEAESEFSRGRVLFVLTDTWHIPHYGRLVAGRAAFEWLASPLPAAGDASATEVSSAVFVILPTFPQRQLAAWTFIRWLNTPQQQAAWTTETGYLPHRRATMDLLAPLLERDPQYAAALALLERETVGEPEVRGYKDCRAHLQRMVQEVLAGGDPQQWLSRTVDACNVTLR
ncbi:MAG: extracellular solute-binding protein [Anaerolineae bacterium]|nr:extracellular solute-binding protein [Anaerolineae bacterium]MCX8068700.1 extracellular solute-binding protein [Anaerolineae bacterium]MDW7991231.1 extracellular solute-binding protein [Anaerolineae bacterium]